MKKTICILLTFAILFAFAACGKNKGEKYVEPPTEILSFEDGETFVYEVVTDAAGEKVTKENGENEVIPYDPPVTEKGGYLVTDPEGSTIKQSATTQAITAGVENDELELDTPVNATTSKQEEGRTESSTSSANKPGVLETTTKLTSAERETTTQKNSSALQEAVTTKKENSTTEKITTAIELPEGETGEFGTEISKADAQRLYNILDFDNTFDAALCESDYYKAEKELPVYIASIETAIAQIKADKTLYQYVGNENLKLWLNYINQAKEKYAIFMGVYRGIEHEDTYPKAFYVTYEDFQNSYRDSLKVYYNMRTGAQAIMYS